MNSLNKKARIEFANFIKKKGLKITKTRYTILEETFSNNNHFTAEEIFIQIKKKKIKASRATIYRTLDLLVESKLLTKLNLGTLEAKYEHILGHGHHDHLICKKCNKVIEFYNSEIETLQDKVCQEYNFKELDHSLKIFGLCSNCQNI